MIRELLFFRYFVIATLFFWFEVLQEVIVNKISKKISYLVIFIFWISLWHLAP